MRRVLLATVLLSLPATGYAAAVIAPGSTVTVTGTNFPGGNGTGVVNVNGSTNIIGDNFVTVGTFNDSISSAWLVVDITGPDAQAIVGDSGADWNFSVDGVTLTGPGVFDNSYTQWICGRSPCQTQNSFNGFQNEGNKNPISDIGPGYGGDPFPPGPAQTVFNFDPAVFVNPYDFVTDGGIPTDANGIEELLHFTLVNPPPTGVPEPASIAVLGLGFAGLLTLRRRS